jgi:hypothetical protein
LALTGEPERTEIAAMEMEATAVASGTRKYSVRRYTEVNNNNGQGYSGGEGFAGNRQTHGGVTYRDVHLFFGPRKSAAEQPSTDTRYRT